MITHTHTHLLDPVHVRGLEEVSEVALKHVPAVLELQHLRGTHTRTHTHTHTRTHTQAHTHTHTGTYTYTPPLSRTSCKAKAHLERGAVAVQHVAVQLTSHHHGSGDTIPPWVGGGRREEVRSVRG
jgi:hypothetical protein